TSGLGHLLVVNTPATLVPSGTVTKVMSQRSQFLYRARATRSVTPSIAGRAGKGWARGEVAVLMRASYIAQHGSGASASGGLTDAGSTGLMRSAGEWAGRYVGYGARSSEWRACPCRRAHRVAAGPGFAVDRPGL